MKTVLCEDTEWLLSEEAFSIYASCMYHPTYEEYKAQMEDYLHDSSVKVFVCENRGKRIGMMVLKSSGVAAEIIGIAVSDNARHKGIGKELIQSVIKSEEIERIKAQTDDDSIGFYRKCGFSEEKLWLSILTGQLFDITAFCINRINSVSRFVRLQGGTMVYYIDDELIIRNMEEADARVFTDEEIAQGWHTDISKYLVRLQDQSAGECFSLTAIYQGQLAGYVSIYITGLSGAFSGKGLPEIVDFGVLEKYQRKGIGSKLMDVAEEIAGQYADTVWLGVGLHSGYGSAQRMYVKRGYIPDGTGVWYRDKPCAQYETEIANDDDLVLFLSKKLEWKGEN